MLACARHPVHTAGMHRLLAFLLIVASSVFAAEKRELWIYKSTNLLVDKNVDELATLLGRAAKAGYTHMLLTDSKFSRLGEMDGRYFKNVERVKTLALQNAIEIVPALFPVGYSTRRRTHRSAFISARGTRRAARFGGTMRRSKRSLF